MMNSIEEYQNLVELLKQALEFYADGSNYEGPMGNIAPIALDEYGSQARFALVKLKELEAQNQKIQEDYNKFMAGYEMLQATDEKADPEELIKVFKTFTNDNNV